MHSSTPALQMWHNIFIKFDRPPIFKSVQLRVMSQHRSRYGFYFVSFKYEKKAKKKKKQMKREREREREGRPVRNCCQLAKILLRSLIKCCGKNSEAMNSIFFSLALFLCFSLSLLLVFRRCCSCICSSSTEIWTSDAIGLVGRREQWLQFRLCLNERLTLQ